MGAAGLSLVISAAIVIALLGEAVVFLSNIDLGQLWTSGWNPRAGQFDIVTIFAGTMMVAIVAILVAAPLGLGAALYLSEYATPRSRRCLKPIIETLAGIPSVVLGYFALTVINPDLVRTIFNTTETFTIMAAGIGVGILTDPAGRRGRRRRDARGPEGSPRGGVRHRSETADSGHAGGLPGGRVRDRRCADPRLLPAIGETMVVAIAAGATGQGTELRPRSRRARR